MAYVLPFYSQFKAVVLLLMLAWRSVVSSRRFYLCLMRLNVLQQGAEIVFKRVLKPIVLPYERPLDAAGWMVGEVLELVFAALLFVPKRLEQWWNSSSSSPDVRTRLIASGTQTDSLRRRQIPSIMAGLRSPHRPPLARALASSIESAQAFERPSRLPVPPEKSEEEAARAPSLTIRRPPANSALATSTSHRPTSSSVPFRPTKSVSSREQNNLSASTSRLARGEASSSRSNSGAHIYPSIPLTQPPVEVWGTSRASTSRPLAPSTSHKGKHRESLEPLPPPPLPTAPLPARHSLSSSTSRPIDLGRTSFSTHDELDFAAPPSPPPTYSPTTPRALPLVPPTPAPPGAFRSSFSPARPRVVAVAQAEQSVAASSPRQKASSALAGLAADLEVGDPSLGLSFGPGKKSKGLVGGVGSRKKTGERTTVQRPGKPRTRRKLDSDDSDEAEASEDEYVEAAPKTTKVASPRKRKAPSRDEGDSTGTETGRVASKRLTTSTRRTATSTGIPTRSRVVRNVKASHSASTSDAEDARLTAPATKKVASSTVVAPVRKASTLR